MLSLVLVTNARGSDRASVGRDRMMRDLTGDLDRLAEAGALSWRRIDLQPGGRIGGALRWAGTGLTLPEAFYGAAGGLDGTPDRVVIAGWPAMGALSAVCRAWPSARLYCDVDDSYSGRLKAWRKAGVGYSPGQIGAGLPGWMALAFSSPLGLALNWADSAKAHHRERQLARAAHSLAYTSPCEARRAGETAPAGLRTHALPPRFRPVREAQVDDAPGRFIFIGTDKLAQNAQSLARIARHWRDHAIGEPVHVYGDTDPARWAPLTVHGFVQDKAEAFSPDSVLLYPCQVGGGLKIKLVEAIEWGIPFLTTKEGLGGLPIGPGSPLVIGDLGEALSRLGSPHGRLAMRRAAHALQETLAATYPAARDAFWADVLAR